jgi:dsDNA-binding SOS-regulon protein
MFNVEDILEKWLKQNQDVILKNISDTILEWLDEHKEEIYDIIKKSKM